MAVNSCPSVAKRDNTVAHRADTTNVSEGFQKHLLCPGHKICVRHKCCARGKTRLGNMITSAMLPPQCVLVLPGPNGRLMVAGPPENGRVIEQYHACSCFAKSYIVQRAGSKSAQELFTALAASLARCLPGLKSAEFNFRTRGVLDLS